MTEQQAKAGYSAENIKVLEGLEAVRLRPALADAVKQLGVELNGP